MDTNETTEKYRLNYWAQIIHERNESGLTIKDYCKGAGFHQNKYFYWQRKLRKAANDLLTANENQAASMQTQHPGFAMVSIKETQVPVDSGKEGKIQVEAAGLKINADNNYPIKKIASLLREVLRSC